MMAAGDDSDEDVDRSLDVSPKDQSFEDDDYDDEDGQEYSAEAQPEVDVDHDIDPALIPLPETPQAVSRLNSFSRFIGQYSQPHALHPTSLEH